MNEPWGCSATDEDNIAAAWVAHFSQIPRGRILVPGAWEGNLCTVGADSRLAGTLLSLHDYTLGGETHPTEADWITSFENNVCGYDSRAVLTEFGVPMNTGVNYDGPRDGVNDVSFLYALTDTVRKQGMGSLLWTGVKFADRTQGPGPCENASCAITSLQGSAPNYTLSINNQSGLDRLQYGWGTGSTGGGGGAATGPLHAVGAGKCLDVPGASQTNGTVTQIWGCQDGRTGSATGSATVMVPPPPPTGSPYVSDLPFTSTNGWGPVERDTSNGEDAAGDGHTITVNVTTYAKGLGAHALSDVTVYLGGNCTAFTAAVGIDDETGDYGSVTYTVLADGKPVATTDVLRASQDPVTLNADITGAQHLDLVVGDGGDGGDGNGSDHADWANAHLTCAN
ncbi:NPCBM/NEW2 domain-containing protein [Streptomyces sp. NRRL F-5123]|uniref:NPCBM/NEW2 domain-containing protein n=1 Tax=Streptomyces sp. NRRL F-5123 TaxID=1463856 RepID=UPI0006931D21|nr:NPCBM/NEW2 domain-containing protein [Streptomyces sp. NRRL F-5123]